MQKELSEEKELQLAALELAAKRAQDEKYGIEQRVRLARQAGASWQQIGNALGVRRQTAWAVYKHVEEEEIR